MPYCGVPYCRSGKRPRTAVKNENVEKLHFFKAKVRPDNITFPIYLNFVRNQHQRILFEFLFYLLNWEYIFWISQSDEQLADWQKAVQRKDRQLTSRDCVCSLHFQSNDIECVFSKILMPDGSVYEYKQKNVRLKATAIPTIFPNYPSYCVPKLKKPRKVPRRCTTVEVMYKWNTVTSLQNSLSCWNFHL